MISMEYLMDWALIMGFALGGFGFLQLYKFIQRRAHQDPFDEFRIKPDKDLAEDWSELPNGGARKVGDTGVPAPTSVREFRLDLVKPESLKPQPQPEPLQARATPRITPAGQDSLVPVLDASLSPLKHRVVDQKARAEIKPAPDFRGIDDFSSDPLMETYESRRPKKKVHIKQPDDFLVINVIAPAGLPWQGRKFLNTVLNQGLRYGAMDIFHFTPPEGSPWFSMANLASPGVFKLDGIGRETFTGVSFFMGLPGPDEPLEAFEKMLDVACHLGQTLGGEIRDGEHRMLTPDALSDYHQRICESMTRAEAPPRPVMA